MKKVSDNRKKGYQSTIKRILDYIGHYKWGVLFSLCLAAITVVTTLYAPILIGDAVDFIVGPNDVDFAGLMGVLQKMGIVILITAVSQWLMNHINNKITYQVVKDIRIKAFPILLEILSVELLRILTSFLKDFLWDLPNCLQEF